MKRNVFEEELNSVEESIDDSDSIVIDADEFMPGDQSLGNAFKIVGILSTAVSSAVAGYQMSKNDVFGKIKRAREERKYQKALAIVERYENPDIYEFEDSEEAEKPTFFKKIRK